MKTEPFDPTDYIKTEEDFAFYLADAQEFGDEGEVRDAEAVIARARVRWSLPPPDVTPAPHRRAG